MRKPRNLSAGTAFDALEWEEGEFLDEFEGVPKEYASAIIALLGGDIAAEIERDTIKKPGKKSRKAA